MWSKYPTWLLQNLLLPFCTTKQWILDYGGVNYPNTIHTKKIYTLNLSCIKIEVSPHITPLDLLTWIFKPIMNRVQSWMKEVHMIMLYELPFDPKVKSNIWFMDLKTSSPSKCDVCIMKEKPKAYFTIFVTICMESLD
jgi:hypothetical protein